MTTTALLVIDVEEEYFSGALPIEHPPRDGSLSAVVAAMGAATAAAMGAAAAAGVPVVVVRQNGSPDGTFEPGTDAWALRPEIETHAHDLLLDKAWPGSFTGTELPVWLEARGIEHVAIAGSMTNICCDTTARQALHLELGVTVLSDAQGGGVPSMPARTAWPSPRRRGTRPRSPPSSSWVRSSRPRRTGSPRQARRTDLAGRPAHVPVYMRAPTLSGGRLSVTLSMVHSTRAAWSTFTWSCCFECCWWWTR